MADKVHPRAYLDDRAEKLQRRVAELEAELVRQEQSRAALSRSDEKFTDIFLNALDVLLIIDVKTGRIITANRALKRILGYEIHDVVGKHFSILDPPEEEATEEDSHETISVHGAVFHAQRTVKADGTEIPMDLTATLIPWEDDTAILATYRDATDRENALQALRESEQRYRTLFDRATDAIIIENERGEILDANRAACQMTGYSCEELLAMTTAELQPGRTAGLALTDDPNVQIETPFEMVATRRDGAQIPIEITIAPFDTSEKTLFLSISRDITERKRAEEELWRAHGWLERRVQERTVELEETTERLRKEISERMRAEEVIKASLAEKEVMLQEIHHRVKNNLQIISSLLALQGRHIEDEKVAQALNDSQNRIRSMALIHAQLYHSEDLARIDFAKYLEDLSNTLLRSYGDVGASVGLAIEAQHVLLSIGTAIPCGLIVNELISNCLKHAFPEGTRGQIRVGLRQTGENQYTLVVADNGRGLPKGLDYRQSKSLGLRLITNLAEAQLRGRLEIRSEDGTRVKIVFEDREQSWKQERPPRHDAE